MLDFKQKIEKITFSFVIAAMLVASPKLFNANSARAELGVAVGNGEGTVLLTSSDGSQEEVSGEILSYYSPNPKSAEVLGL